MLRKLYREIMCPHDVHVFQNSYYRLRPYQFDDNGVLKQQTEFYEFDPVQENCKYYANDFSIANIVAVGATDMLKPFALSKMSDMTFVDQFSASMASVMNNLNMNNYELV